MERSEAVLFDFDGTLADSIAAVCHATNDTLADWRRPGVDKREILFGMQYKTIKRLGYHSGITDPDVLAEMMRRFYRRLHERAKLVEPYPGTLELVEELKNSGVRLGIVSNNDGEFVRTVLRDWNAEGLFDLSLGEPEFEPLKPDPAGINLTLERLGAAAAAAVYVGDSESDAAAAREAGVHSIGVAWSHRKYGLTPAVSFPRRVERPEELKERIQAWRALLHRLPPGLLRGTVRKRIYVMRHCESEANRRDILAARQDYPLSEGGHAHAELVAERFLRERSIDRIVASPLARARQTAEPFGRRSGIPVESGESLVEHELGVFTGLPKAEIAARGDYPTAKSGRWLWRPQGGETYQEIYERVVAFLLGQVLAGPGQSTLLVSHAITMRMIRAFLENSAPLYPEEIAENGEIWEVDFVALGKAHPVRELRY